MIDFVRVGKKIQEERLSHGMSQDVLGEALSVTRQALSRWENGLSAPSIDSLITLSKIFGVSIEELLCLDESPEIDPENISTILNLVELLNRKRDENFHADKLSEIEGSIKRIIEDLKGRRLPIWSLSRVFGYVRSPVLFTQLGWSWAASGQPGIALSGIQRAESIAATPAARSRLSSGTTKSRSAAGSSPAASSTSVTCDPSPAYT